MLHNIVAAAIENLQTALQGHSFAIANDEVQMGCGEKLHRRRKEREMTSKAAVPFWNRNKDDVHIGREYSFLCL